MIENSEKKVENTHLREVGFAFILLLDFEFRLIQLLFHVCPSSQLPFILSFKEYCHGWERSEIGEEGEMGLSKEEYTKGNPICAGVGLGYLPCGFLF